MICSLRLPRIFFVVSASLVLAGCGIFGRQVDLGLSPEMAQKCPPVGIVAYTGEMTRFTGNSRDASAVVDRGAIGSLTVVCQDTEDETALVARISFDISAMRGPANRTGTAEFPFFVTVTRGNEAVLDKNLYTSTHQFGGQSTSVQREMVTAWVPLGEGGRILNTEILIGFQLTKDELAYNVSR